MDDFDRMRLAAHDIARSEAFENLSAQDINRMDIATYARATGRPTPVQAALQAIGAQQPPATPQSPPEAPQAPQGSQDQHQAIDASSDEYFLAWRANRTSGGAGRGIFDSVSSRSDEYRDAARRQTGRTAYSQSNVTPAPSLTGRHLRHDDQIDHRSAAERFSTASNAFNL